ncbi:MAG: hypothetical protein J2P31_12570, partial [Blastocatellia bacterium]|nr:hypothetical protein [Blastocatellia bacterium]
DKWSIRVGYGMFEMFRNSETYARDNGNNSNLGYGFTPNGNLGNNAGQIAFQLQNGPPPNSVFYPTVSNLTAGSFNGSVIGYYPRPVPLSYMQQFVISVQRELLGRQIMDVSYVHTKGTHLPFTTDRNQIPVANWLDTNPNNTGVSGAARPYPWYESILEHDFNGWSNYDALQVRFLKNYSSGVSYQFNYTYSKMMDTGSQGGHNSLLTSPWQIAGDPRANYARSDLDFPHSFNGQITYELPVGAGRQFAVRGLLDKIAGGWRLSSIMTAHSGTPYTVLYSVPSMSDYTGAGVCGCNFSLYPNRTGSGTLSNPTAQQWFDPSAFSLPNFVTTTVTTSSGTVTYDQFAPGNSGRNTLRGPRFWSADLSIAKAFRIRDRVTLEIRADSLNFFNHTNLSVANLNRTIAFVKNAAGQYVVSPDNTGGQITNTVVPPGGNFANGGARMFQLGGRISF